MEIILLFLGWVILLYIIHLNKELSRYRNLQKQHDDIYVPSLQDLVSQNHWTLQLVRFIFRVVENKKNRRLKFVLPYVRKKISNISLAFINKKSN